MRRRESYAAGSWRGKDDGAASVEVMANRWEVPRETSPGPGEISVRMRKEWPGFGKILTQEGG